MKSVKITQGDVGDRSKGIGNVSPALVTTRAEEIAIADGRLPEDFTDEDWAQALRELRNSQIPAPDQVSEEVEAAAPLGEVPSSIGRQIPKYPLEDEETIAEDLVEQGIDEAVHDEEVEAGKVTLEDKDLSGEPPKR
jgi:hypothetical protein